MRLRAFTGIALVLIMLPFLWLGSWPLLYLNLFLAFRALYELQRMKQIKFFSLSSVLSYFSISIFVLFDQVRSLFPTYFQPPYFFMMVTILFLIIATIDREFDYNDAGVMLFGTIYIGFGFYSMSVVRNQSLLALLFIVLCIWACDTGAYLFGKMFGKNKLAPLISPNKTIEGSVAGTLCSVIVALGFNLFKLFKYSPIQLILYGIIFAMSGQLGDLIESGLKRQYEVKDSGRILPGHGGILDRFDSLLLALSVAILLGFA